jgi:hypothetical protein
VPVPVPTATQLGERRHFGGRILEITRHLSTSVSTACRNRPGLRHTRFPVGSSSSSRTRPQGRRSPPKPLPRRPGGSPFTSRGPSTGAHHRRRSTPPMSWMQAEGMRGDVSQRSGNGRRTNHWITMSCAENGMVAIGMVTRRYSLAW